MKVERIQHYKGLFVEYLHDLESNPTVYHYECQANWQKYWYILAEDFAECYDESLQSKISGSLWGGQQNSPKSVMMEMMKHNEVFIRDAFKDLLKDENDLGLRLDRFTYHCDEVFYSMMHNSNRHSTHHHNDRRYLAMYLCFQFPDRYGLWDYPSFVSMLTKFESRNIPQEVEIERYFKTQRAIYTVLSKDEDFIRLALIKLTGGHTFNKTLLIINDFQTFVASQP